MNRFYSQAATDAGDSLDEFTRAYIECLYFTDTGEEGQPDVEDELSPDALAACVSDCADFQESAAEMLAEVYATGYTPEQAGHDFWLTRNWHGAGFWDRGLGEVGHRLSDHARAYGGCDAYTGNDGRVYLS